MGVDPVDASNASIPPRPVPREASHSSSPETEAASTTAMTPCGHSRGPPSCSRHRQLSRHIIPPNAHLQITPPISLHQRIRLPLRLVLTLRHIHRLGRHSGQTTSRGCIGESSPTQIGVDSKTISFSLTHSYRYFFNFSPSYL
jgi:hypothetical protein